MKIVSYQNLSSAIQYTSRSLWFKDITSDCFKNFKVQRKTYTFFKKKMLLRHFSYHRSLEVRPKVLFSLCTCHWTSNSIIQFHIPCHCALFNPIKCLGFKVKYFSFVVTSISNIDNNFITQSTFYELLKPALNSANDHTKAFWYRQN